MRKRIEIRKCFLALLGILLIGVGVSFNAMAKLGNDPVGIFYDGIRNALGLNQEQLGMASNLVNIVLLVFLFFAGFHLLEPTKIVIGNFLPSSRALPLRAQTLGSQANI